MNDCKTERSMASSLSNFLTLTIQCLMSTPPLLLRGPVRVGRTPNHKIEKKFNIGDSWCHTAELRNSNTSKGFLLPPTFCLTHTLSLSHAHKHRQTRKERADSHRGQLSSTLKSSLDQNTFCILCGKTSSQSLKEDWRCTRCEVW